jgi:Protein of unknown function (DUF2934)
MAKQVRAAMITTLFMEAMLVSDTPLNPSSNSPEAQEAERRQRIAETAYWRAAARGFAHDRHLDDWLQAEREIDALAVLARSPDDGRMNNPESNESPFVVEEETRLRGDTLGANDSSAVDQLAQALKRNPDRELRLDGERDTLYNDGLDIDDDGETLAGTDGRGVKSIRR